MSGDLKKPIARKSIPLFLENLFPAFPYRISAYNVKEVLDVFGRNGTKSKHIFWPDFRKILRERKSGLAEYHRDAVFVKTTFNPDSWVMRFWRYLMEFVGIYYFVVVPIRISFDPWRRMVDFRALSTDLVIDGITVINLAVAMNTCYTNSRAAIITNRIKILRRIDYSIAVPAFPLDW